MHSGRRIRRRSVAHRVLLPVLLAAALAGCGGDTPVSPDTGAFTIEAKYSYIRSYPGGGGVFLVRLVPGDGFSGHVDLALEADPALGALLDRDALTAASRIAEVTLRPSASVEMKTHEIRVLASQGTDLETVTLLIEMFDWSSDGVDGAIPKRDELVAWLEAAHPELGSFSGGDWYAYVTYPQILVVEHWTFLNAQWEMRIDFHVTAPPDDWSYIAIRGRGDWDFLLAAKRESDGTTNEIPIAEYPTMFGY